MKITIFPRRWFRWRWIECKIEGTWARNRDIDFGFLGQFLKQNAKIHGLMSLSLRHKRCANLHLKSFLISWILQSLLREWWSACSQTIHAMVRGAFQLWCPSQGPYFPIWMHLFFESLIVFYTFRLVAKQRLPDLINGWKPRPSNCIILYKIGVKFESSPISCSIKEVVVYRMMGEIE